MLTKTGKPLRYSNTLTLAQNKTNTEPQIEPITRRPKNGSPVRMWSETTVIINIIRVRSVKMKSPTSVLVHTTASLHCQFPARFPSITHTNTLPLTPSLSASATSRRRDVISRVKLVLLRQWRHGEKWQCCCTDRHDTLLLVERLNALELKRHAYGVVIKSTRQLEDLLPTWTTWQPCTTTLINSTLDQSRQHTKQTHTDENKMTAQLETFGHNE